MTDERPGQAAERRIGELQAALEAKSPDPRSVDIASRRVAAALALLTRETPPAELARVLDLHACVRETVTRHRIEAATEIARTRSERERLSRLTRPNDASGSLDIRA